MVGWEESSREGNHGPGMSGQPAVDGCVLARQEKRLFGGYHLPEEHEWAAPSVRGEAWKGLLFGCLVVSLSCCCCMFALYSDVYHCNRFHSGFMVMCLPLTCIQLQIITKGNGRPRLNHNSRAGQVGGRQNRKQNLVVKGLRVAICRRQHARQELKCVLGSYGGSLAQMDGEQARRRPLQTPSSA